MPSITLSTVSASNIKVRWQEPLASQSLNQKLAAVVPAGVYRGLVLGVSTSNLSVNLSADANGDHIAVHENHLGFSTTYSDNSSGTMTLPLTGFPANTAVVICLYVNYTTGSSTVAEFRGYSIADYDALPLNSKRDLLVIGTAFRPTAGIIPAVNITHDRRSLPFINRTDESTPWNPLIRNSGFELGHTNGSYRHSSPFWKSSSTNLNFSLRTISTDSNSGAKSLELFSSLAGAVIAESRQDLWMPVVPGRYVMARLHKKVVSAPLYSPLPVGKIRFVFGDLNGSNDVTEDLLFDIFVVNYSFEEVTGIVKVPAAARVLKLVQVIIDATYPAAGSCIRIDDVQSWAQVDAANWFDVQDARSTEVAIGDLFLGTSNSFDANSAKISFDGSKIVVDRRDEDLSKLPPSISIQPRTTGSIEYTLLIQSVPAGGRGYRKYVSSTGRVFDVINASYDNVTNLWTKDVTGFNSFRQEIKEAGFSNSSRVADAAWIDAAWIEHVSSAIPEVTSLSNQKFSPVLMTRGPTGGQRVAIDHLGLRGGRVTVLHQNWLAPMAASWNSLVLGTGSNFIGFSDSLIEGPVQHQIVAAPSDRAGSYVPSRIFSPPIVNQVHVVEYELNATDLAGTPNLQWQGGFMHDEIGDPSSENFAKLSKTSASPNWFLKTRGGSTTGAGASLDTGIAAGGLQRFRLEAYGSAMPGGARVLAYINGLLVAESTSSLMDNSQEVTLSFSFKAGAIAGSKQVVLSPVTYTVARHLSDDSL
jgi:hypothetical protein